MRQTSVRLVTLLSPLLYETYEYIARYLGERLDLATSLHAGCELTRGEAELGFLCGLLYIHLRRASSCAFELLAAPVLLGERYQNAPLYFSDVVVRRDSPYAALEELRGCAWAFNETASHSGYNLVRYSLLRRGLPLDYFGQGIETGTHLHSLRAVLDGQAEAAALDSHLLDVLFQREPSLRKRLRIVESLGPSPIPPLVIARELEPALKKRIRSTLLTIHSDPQAAHELRKGQISRFVPVTDADYQPIRAMFELVQNQSSQLVRS